MHDSSPEAVQTSMRLLLTNDDGIEAPGLAALARAVEGIGATIVVAPRDVHSGGSHRVTTDRAIDYETRGPNRHAVDGTPADCVRLGLFHRLAEPTWVLAGVNAGGNLGADIYYSGTVAAVREACFNGLPGIAFSHYIRKGEPVDWDQAVRWVAPLVRTLLERDCPPWTFWNVNLPHLPDGASAPEVVYCEPERRALLLSYREDEAGWRFDGDYHRRPRVEGSDVDVCFSGRIAVSQLALFGAGADK